MPTKKRKAGAFLMSKSSASRPSKSRATALARTGGRYVASLNRRGRSSVNPVESKNIDTTISIATQFPIAVTTGVVTLLNGVTTGTAANTRIGRKIVMKSILLRMSIVKGATTAGEGNMRVMIVYDKQSNQSSPPSSEILSPDSIAGLNNLNNVDRFKIITDKFYSFGIVDNTAINIQKYKKLNLPVQYNAGAAGTIGDIQTGALYLVTYTNGNYSVAAPTGQAMIRLRFLD